MPGQPCAAWPSQPQGHRTNLFRWHAGHTRSRPSSAGVLAVVASRRNSFVAWLLGRTAPRDAGCWRILAGSVPRVQPSMSRTAGSSGATHRAGSQTASIIPSSPIKASKVSSPELASPKPLSISAANSRCNSTPLRSHQDWIARAWLLRPSRVRFPKPRGETKVAVSLGGVSFQNGDRPGRRQYWQLAVPWTRI